MKTEQLSDDNEYPSTLDELITDIELNTEKYMHLQFILNRQKHINLGLGQLYLVVNNVGFGLYRLDDVDYKDGVICFSFTNPASGNKTSTSVGINNKYPQIFIINWSDIEDLVHSEITNSFTGNELRDINIFSK